MPSFQEHECNALITYYQIFKTLVSLYPPEKIDVLFDRYGQQTGLSLGIIDTLLTRTKKNVHTNYTHAQKLVQLLEELLSAL